MGWVIRKETKEYIIFERDDLPSKTVKRGSKKLGRNDKCICGSGLKYKKCCLNK